MAKLKIGSGIRLEAQLPKTEQAPVQQDNSSFDMTDSLKKLIELMPQPEKQKEVELSHLATKDELSDVIASILSQKQQLEEQVQAVSNKLNALPVEKVQPAIVQPTPIKYITSVKDVSPDIIDKCKSLISLTESSIMLKISDLQKENRQQKKINYVLSGLVLLTIFLHLL